MRPRAEAPHPGFKGSGSFSSGSFSCPGNLLAVGNQVARTTGATIGGNQVKQPARRGTMDEIV